MCVIASITHPIGAQQSLAREPAAARTAGSSHTPVRTRQSPSAAGRVPNCDPLPLSTTTSVM
eukprot:3631406-Pyramimonas_sp.AAC.2